MDGKTFNFPKDYWFSDFRVLISGPETPGLVQSLAKECRVYVMNYKSVRKPHWCVNITVPVLVYEELTLDNIPAKNAGWVGWWWNGGQSLEDLELALKVADIDAVRRRVHVRDGKGNRDRFVPVSYTHLTLPTNREV